MHIQTFQALWSLNKISSQELPSLAADLLLSGTDSNSLRILAGLDKTDWEGIARYLNKSIHELHLVKLTDKEASLVLAKDVAEKIVSGELDPEKGAREIWSLWNISGHAVELSGFVNDVSDYEESYPKDSAILESIKKKARNLTQKD